MKTNPTTRPSANRTCTQTLASHCRSVLFWKPCCLMASIRPAQSALRRTWKIPNANHTVDLPRVGSLTHADHSMAFVLKSSPRTVNRIPMLMIGRFRGEPPIPILAQRALHHSNEVLANLRLVIASAPICHHPHFGRALQI